MGGKCRSSSLVKVRTEPPATLRPPSVDALARSHRDSGLPHAVLVDLAREAIANFGADAASQMADLTAGFLLDLLQPVVNATGVLLHTNLGRAPLAVTQPDRAMTVEFNLRTGQRGSRNDTAGPLLARLCGAEAAMVVNNNAAAVLLVLAALAEGREVPVARGESVEIGGAFRVPEVMEQSGARLVDVGTTNRTRLSDYAKAISRPGADVAMVLKVHPSNYRVEGFVEETGVGDLATLGVPVVADIGSGLLDADTPWLGHGPPAWLAGEPAAKQTLAAGADLVTFSGDKLLGGPQAGIIAGRADLVKACASHPLARALRPGGLLLGALQETALAYLRRDLSALAFWRMADTPVEELRTRAGAICAALGESASERFRVGDSEALVGAGSAPGTTISSVALTVPGDHLARVARSSSPGHRPCQRRHHRDRSAQRRSSR
jgi:L-seryl-tRNA(Ser) seleniumtransferase